MATIQARRTNFDVRYMTIHACLSLGVHLCMVFTVKKERAYIPQRMASFPP